MPLLPPVDETTSADGLAAVDLFCGLGGLSLGLREAGFVVQGAIEADGYAVEAYRANHPQAWVWQDDIQDVSPSEVLDVLGLAGGELPLLAGCPPCEGFSRLRSRNGRHAVDDDRNDLVSLFMSYTEVIKPAVVMLENVPGLAADSRFEELLVFLKGRAYEVTQGILDAAHYGVPQRRQRLIVVASRLGTIAFPRRSEERVTVRQAFRPLPPAGASGDPAHDVRMKHTERIQRLIEGIPRDGGSRTDLPPEEQLGCHARFDGFKDVYGRMAWDEVAPTITGGCASPSKGRFLHPELDRVITLREAAMLQSFPIEYAIPMRRGRYAAAELIGNALPPKMISHLAKPIRNRIVEASG